jgi:branched-chain amino acid transport system substrate-binding protein
VVAILTTVGSETLAVADIAARAQVPIFAMVSTPSVTDKSQPFYKWVFRAMSPTNADLFITADKISADKRKRLSIFFVEDAFGQQYSQLMSKAAAERGVEVATVASVAGDTTDMTSVALKIRNSKPDSVYIAASNMGLVSAFMRKLREVGETAQVYGQANMINAALFKTAGDSADGLVASTLLNPQVPGKLAPLFDLMKNNGGVRGVGEVVGSNAMVAVVEALKAGGVDGPSVREKAETMGPIKGYAAAPFHYTADNHDGWPPQTLMLVTVKDGKFVTLET